MDWITDEIAIGNYLEAQDAASLKQHAFRSVLSLDGTLGARQATEFGLSEVVSYRLIDGAGNDPRLFRFAIDDLRRLVDSHSPVLVQCHAGRSRSAAIVVGYLILVRRVEPKDAIEIVAAKREINIMPALVDLLHSLGLNEGKGNH